MPEWFASTMEKLLDLSSILNASIAASWMVLAVIVLRLLLKKIPRWTHVALWGLVAVRLLLPFSIESSFSLIPSTETIPQEMLVYEGEQLRDSAFLDIVTNPVFSEGITVEVGETVDCVQINLIKMTPIWIAGIAALLLYTAVSYWHLRRKVSEATVLRDNIYQSENVASPFVLGIIKPKIYLPYGISEQDRGHVVAHEQAHIRRGDHWWKPLGFFLLTIHWFNPIMWLAYILLCRDIELACDERVIKELGAEQRADYTQALVACSVNRRTIAACPLAFGEVGVKERVKSVMNYKKPAFWIIVLSVVACAVVAVCFLTDPVTSVRNPWVQEYVPGAEGIIGNVDKEKYESISEDFAIGADQYGRAVFKDPHKAFDTFVILFADGIKLIQEQNDLAPISRKNYSAYKAMGWQVTSGSEEAQQQAIFVTKFLDIYENSFTKDIPSPNTEIPTTEPTPSVTKWFDFHDEPSEMPWSGRLEIDIPEFPDVTFRWYPEKIEAVTENETTPLYHGMPIWNTYFCDLTGDDLPELCSTYSFGSGMIDSRVIIYDYANGASYELSDRGFYDYSLRQNDSDGQLYVDKRSYPGRGLIFSGQLVFKDGCIQILGQGTVNTAITDIVDPTKDENFAYDTAVEKFFEDENNEYLFSGIYSQYVVVHYADGTTEDVVTALNSGRATLADLDRFGIRYWAESKGDPLEAAISAAILDHYASDEPDGLIHVESHVLLANEAMSGTPLFGANDHAEKVIVYLLVHHVKYSTYGGQLEAVGGSYVPTAITFKVSNSREYILEEYWEPRDGIYYADDIRKKFPGASADDALNDQAYIEELKAQTYSKALAYLNSNRSLDVIIEELLGKIQSSPAHSSNPGDYIHEHETEYAELLGYGEYTLRYCFTEFLRGSQYDLRGHIMALACEDIMLAWGEAYTIDGTPLTGQDRFNEFCGNAEKLAVQYSHEELEKNFPGAFLLLQIMGDTFATKD